MSVLPFSLSCVKEEELMDGCDDNDKQRLLLVAEANPSYSVSKVVEEADFPGSVQKAADILAEASRKKNAEFNDKFNRLQAEIRWLESEATKKRLESAILAQQEANRCFAESSRNKEEEARVEPDPLTPDPTPAPSPESVPVPASPFDADIHSILRRNEVLPFLSPISGRSSRTPRSRQSSISPRYCWSPRSSSSKSSESSRSRSRSRSPNFE